jgi:hypothetical protein
MRITYTLLIIILYLSACSGDSAKKSVPTLENGGIIKKIPADSLAIPDNRFSNKYEVLMFGNSHTLGVDILIETLISKGSPEAQINVVNATGGFLDNISQAREDIIKENPWSHIILQGQKYSQSGISIYPTTAAEMWIDMAKKHEIMPILFPEHPQKGNVEEGRRVHLIHTGIAAKQNSCVAPVGLTWNKVILIEPQLVLHTPDGNHATYLGRLLTAYVFYEVITGKPADLLPFIEEIKVEEATQHFLKQLVSETIQSYQPCIFDQ